MRTRKAYAAAAASALAAVLAATSPFLDGRAATAVYVVLAALGALGVTYRVPNALPLGSVEVEGGRLTGPVDLLGAAAQQFGGALGAPDVVEPSRLTAVLDAVPAYLTADTASIRGGDAGQD
jgi:hypothetical protein